MTSVDHPGWDDPDRAVQIEDENPEALAGAEVEFDEAADDQVQEDFPPEGNAGVTETANLPAEGV